MPSSSRAASTALSQASPGSCRPGLSGGKSRELAEGIHSSQTGTLSGFHDCLPSGELVNIQGQPEHKSSCWQSYHRPVGPGVSACLPKCSISFPGATEVPQRDEANKPLHLFVCHFSLVQVLQDSIPTGSQSQHVTWLYASLEHCVVPELN